MVHEILDNEEVAKEKIKNENTWQSYGRSSNTKDGLKVYYDCVHKGCSKRIGIWYDMEDAQKVRIVKSANVEHDHSHEDSLVWGLNEDTKKAIEHLFVMGTKTAQACIYALRNPAIIAVLPESIIKENSLSI